MSNSFLYVSGQVSFTYDGQHTDGKALAHDTLTIGIETNVLIKKGQEVYVDYGARFWPTEDEDIDDVNPVRIHFTLHTIILSCSTVLMLGSAR